MQKSISPQTKGMIKNLWLTGQFTLKELALKYNIDESTVSDIITRMFSKRKVSQFSNN